MSYDADHASAYADIAPPVGAAIVFTWQVQGTEVNGRFTGRITGSMAGVCTEDPGDKQTYKDLGLVQSEAPRLFFIADNYGDIPPMGASCLYGEDVTRPFTVADVQPYRPDGKAVFSHVIIKR